MLRPVSTTVLPAMVPEMFAQKACWCRTTPWWPLRTPCAVWLGMGLACALAGCAARAPSGGEVFVHDLGNVFLDPAVPSSQTISHTFTFRNPSKSRSAELKVEKKSCGCSRCEIKQVALGPAEETEITLSFDAGYMRTARRETVEVTTGLAEYPRFVLVLAAEIYPRLAMVPETRLAVQSLPHRRETIRTAFVAYEPANDKAAPLRVRVHGGRLALEQTRPWPSRTLGGVRKTSVDCTVSVGSSEADIDNLGVERVGGFVEVVHGNRRIKKDVFVLDVSPIAASPRQVFLQAAGHDGADAVVVLKAEEAFCITSITTDNPDVHASASLLKRVRSHEVRIRLSRPDSTGLAGKGQLTIATDHPVQRTVRVPVFVLW